MTHLRIELSVAGDQITAISQALEIARALNKDLELQLKSGQFLTVRSESHIQDLITIAALEDRLHINKE